MGILLLAKDAATPRGVGARRSGEEWAKPLAAKEKSGVTARPSAAEG